MKQTWRWFGPNDPIALGDLPMVGVQGIVSALHDLPPGVAWPKNAIARRKALINSSGLTWDVVESLPVSEEIKTQGRGFKAHIQAYKESLANVASEGLTTVCYNFMPILDWTRTTLRLPQAHGGNAMAFDLLDFAAFDIHILLRPNALENYSVNVVEQAAERHARMADSQREELMKTVVLGLPGANDGWTLEDVRARLTTYNGIGNDDLRRHLIDFLSEVVPTAESLGLRLCCHPDDPPFSLLGLPRVMSSIEDYEHMLGAVDICANGATLCTGSLGVSERFSGPEFVKKLGSRIHFVHLRNTRRTTSVDPAMPDFYEAPHLDGDTDMVGTVRALVSEEAKRRKAGRSDAEIPMRPDHGQELLSDRGGQSLPGYPLLGRMRGLAELRGLMAAAEYDHS